MCVCGDRAWFCYAVESVTGYVAADGEDWYALIDANVVWSHLDFFRLIFLFSLSVSFCLSLSLSLFLSLFLSLCGVDATKAVTVATEEGSITQTP